MSLRRRLLIVLLLAAVIAVAGFAIPFAGSISAGRTGQLVLDRTRDADRFAAMTTSNDQKLTQEARRYHELYGEGVVLIDSLGRVRCNAAVDLKDPAVRHALSEASANELPSSATDLLPWGPAHILVARHWGDAEQMGGAVLIVASTATARADIATGWTALIAGALAALAAFTVLALRLARWILQPLDTLSRAVGELTAALPVPRGGDRPVTREENGPPEIRALRRSVDTLALTVADSVDAQRQLVADTAHAMRNPLAALAVRLESMEPAVRGETEPAFRGAVREVHRLTALLDGLLALAVAETPTDSQLGRAETVAEPRCDGVVAAADRVDAWYTAFAQAGRTLTLDSEVRAAEMDFPESALIQILDVALSNSCRYAGPGADTAVVVRCPPGRVVVTVTDDGTGVPESDIARLTERFFRGGGAVTGGSGLGLTIAAALAHRHGGALTIEARRPHGLTLSLTAAVPDRPNPERATETAVSISPQAAGP